MPNILSLKCFLPELILSGGALLLILYSVIARPFILSLSKDGGRSNLPNSIAIISLLISLLFTLSQWNIGNPPLFHGLLILDRPAMFFKAIFAVTTVIVLIFSLKMTDDKPEYYALLLGAVVGMNMLASANNLLVIYLALEFVSLMSYMLVGWTFGSRRSSEAALKYVLYGAVASGIFLFGASLYYGLTGTLDLGVAHFSARELSQAKASYSLAGLLLLAGFLFKIAAVPMQAWCPDAYEGAPTPITAFLSVAPKAAGFAVLMRVASEVGITFNWPIVIAIISAATMTFGNLAAIPQTNLKRLLAYSSIAHAGYLLMGISCFTQKGDQAIYFYFIAYLIMNLGAFLVVQIVANQSTPPLVKGGEGGFESIESYSGLGRRGTYGAILGIAMTIFLLSLTGVPPFVGFIGKFYIFSAVIDAKLYWLAIIGIANSVVSLYYYMRIVRAMFFEAPKETSPIPFEFNALTVTLIILVVATILFGIFWQPLSTLVTSIV